ncbi:hypothetical protein AB6A40_001926 [Gnathostoma spinigerum]|uniref:NOC3-like protein n=1 Tax=Gnathostoma spinigerum TaxID=75299 RepID=A0ABD6EFB3_9BILA
MGRKERKQKKSVKSNKVKKVMQRLQRHRRRGNLKKHEIDAIDRIKAKKKAEPQKRLLNIEEDWKKHCESVMKDESDDDNLPLDMYDTDIDWENSVFAQKKQRLQESDESGPKYHLRHFKSEEIDENMEPLLPLKVGGKLIAQSRKIEEIKEEEPEEAKVSEEEEAQKVDDTSHLSAIDLLRKGEELVHEQRIKISNTVYSILADPQNEMPKLKALVLSLRDKSLIPLVKEATMQLLTASLTQVFIDIVPGYVIRLPTEEELATNLKKETKRLFEYERSLLTNYRKFLEFLEKKVERFISSKRKRTSQPDRDKLGLLSLRCLCKLLVAIPHFNYTTNILDILIRVSTSEVTEVVETCCSAIGTAFSQDTLFRLSAHGSKNIAKVVKDKGTKVPPSLLATFLKLRIKEIDSGKINDDKKEIMNKKQQVFKERASKSRTKFRKQLQKLEADLKEIEAKESVATRSKYATEAMKNVFLTYFRVLKLMSTTSLLAPVLQGLSKFAHLLNVEFFDDIISAMESLVEMKHLSVSDVLHCIHTVFVILSGEGSAINVDPLCFYRSLYRILPCIVFTRSHATLCDRLSLIITAVQLMFVNRSKAVPLERVAAFVKRLLLLSFLLPNKCIVAVLSSCRAIFIAHQRLRTLIDFEETVNNGMYRPDLDDPDCSHALSSSILPELDRLAQNSNKMIALFARHLIKNAPSTGPCHLSPEIGSKKPWEWLECTSGAELCQDSDGERSFFHGEILEFAKKRGVKLTSTNVCQLVCQWLSNG